jgi:phosphoribosylaminoimidazole-succinocarboxamide synthase
MKKMIILETNLSGLKPLARGKVRDIYEIDDYLLIVATDRISAFDVILPSGIPYKGQVLTALSTFWFGFMKSITPSHLITADDAEIIKRVPVLREYRDQLSGRSMLVRKAGVFPVECIVRGYLAGSGWKEYQQTNSICGIKLPAGLKESEQLPQIIFTPSTKAVTGHDENISLERMQEIIGQPAAQVLSERSRAVYEAARRYALTKGIIISDTKFEWGEVAGEIILVDEVLTPDSSRFWPRDSYQAGKSQPSFDKQFVRDYLESIGWDKKPPAPKLPDEIIRKTSEKYLEAYRRITGNDL